MHRSYMLVEFDPESSKWAPKARFNTFEEARAAHANNARASLIYPNEIFEKIGVSYLGTATPAKFNECPIEIEGEFFQSIQSAAYHFDVVYATIEAWLRSGKATRHTKGTL